MIQNGIVALGNLSMCDVPREKGTNAENIANLILVSTQAEINNRTNVDLTLDANFRLSAESRNDNDVLRWYNTSFQHCINTGNQHIFNTGCQHF